ncbi:MAG TPA: polyprenol monophosphomannose synthase [Actinopolymorphaceae bacterium]
MTDPISNRSGAGSPSTVVVVPTYNEADNLERIISRVHAAVAHADVLVVDDASPDGTGDVADKLATLDSRIHVLHRPGKQGLGVAYLAGFAWALERHYEVVCEMDADGSHPPESIPDLLAALDDADLVIGSRWVPGGRIENWSWGRKVMSLSGNLYARLVLGFSLRDSTSGFRAFRRSALEAVDLGDVASQGYCFQMDLARRAVRAGLRVVEVPITFADREYGVSKMSLGVAMESLIRVTRWGLRDRFDRSRSRVDGRTRRDAHEVR